MANIDTIRPCNYDECKDCALLQKCISNAEEALSDREGNVLLRVECRVDERSVVMESNIVGSPDEHDPFRTEVQCPGRRAALA